MKRITKRIKFQKKANELYIKKFRIYPPFIYSRLDKWLKSMSLKGWHIVHCGLFLFWFEKGDPAPRTYFTYGLSTQEGKYDLSLRYPLLEKTYGVKKQKSKINSNETKAHQIIEIDHNKIDIENDIGYKELINDRNHLYTKYFVRNLLLISVSVIISMALFAFFN